MNPEVRDSEITTGSLPNSESGFDNRHTARVAAVDQAAPKSSATSSRIPLLATLSVLVIAGVAVAFFFLRGGAEAPTKTETTVRRTTDAPVAAEPVMTEEEMFLVSVNASYDGYGVLDNVSLFKIGYAVCEAFDAGLSAEAVAIAGASTAEDSDQLQLVTAVLAAAVAWLCPEYAGAFG